MLVNKEKSNIWLDSLEDIIVRLDQDFSYFGELCMAAISDT